MKVVERISVLAIVVVMAISIAGCGQSATSSSSASSGAGSSSATSNAELVGSPWVTSVLSGNLPAEQPAAKDDLYTHYNYEYLAAHQGQDISIMDYYSGELQYSVTKIIKDSSKAGHDLDQLRIFYNQAADTDALKAAGLSEVQPYLDRIDAVSSIEEMNALLSDKDFPFNPFISAYVTINDTRATNIVDIEPNFIFSNVLETGNTFYKDSDDPQEQQNLDMMLNNQSGLPMVDLLCAGASQEEVARNIKDLITFEKAHGKYVTSSSDFLKSDYGAAAQNARESYFTLDEVCSMAPNLPMRGILEKMGKGGSATYVVTKAWLEALNGLWTEKNLDTIKLAAKAKVLGETRPYRDPTYMNSVLEQAGQPVPDADSFAFTACTSIDTFGQVVAKTYVDNVLGENAKTRLTTISNRLVETYRTMVESTAWLGDESKAKIVEKLEHITLNVLEPVDGYFDYSGLELVPTDNGGTLLSNYLKLKQYRQECESKLIGQPATTAIMWYAMTPTTANAFYDAASNSINIFPGYVTSLIYSEEMSDTALLARAGFSIGHEISHSFDYLSSQADAYGTPNPIYSDADVDKFVTKSSSLALYYNGIEITPEQNVDGALVVTEATADLCGMQACLEIVKNVDGFDYDFFFSSLCDMFAQVVTDDTLSRSMFNLHALSNLRVNVSAQMLDEIYEKLGVAEGDGMYLAPNERIVILGPNA